jgi:hypothetical protein
LGNDREEEFILLVVVVVVVNVSLLSLDEAEVAPEEEDNNKGVNISFFLWGVPHKKGSASTPNMHASVAVFMGRRAVRESFTKLTTKLSKKSGYYKGKRSISPGWHEKKVGGGGRGRFVLLDWKKPTYVIPEGLNEFTLKAYVAKGVTK